MGKLRITRGTEWLGRLMKLHVYVDDVEIGTVAYNDYQDFDLSDGEHMVFIKIDIFKSKVQKILIESGKRATFRIRLPDIWRPINLLLTIFDGGNQISFEPVSTDARI